MCSGGSGRQVQKKGFTRFSGEKVFSCHFSFICAQQMSHFCPFKSTSVSKTALFHRGKKERESRGGSVWENGDARSSACKCSEMLHVAVVIQACIHVAVVSQTCLFLPQGMLPGRRVSFQDHYMVQCRRQRVVSACG